MTQRTIEILAPAGSYAAFEAAVNAGADAVYAGGQKFGARAYAENFTEEEMIRAIRKAHLQGRKFYLTVNTLLKDSEISGLYEYLAPFYENGLDAVIVQDVGVLEYVRQYFPGMDIHASTQMTITGALGASFLESQGVSRVVPARELSLREIHEIRQKTNLEIECFVHGALCYCYSGQCLFSSMIGGRSGNRGQCAQPCRLPYQFGGQRKYFLSPKDICTLELIPDLAEAGIDSFKIEGRMKKPEYVAGVTSMYRKYADLYLERGRGGFAVHAEDRGKLMDLYNRGGSSAGYYQKHNGREMMAVDRPNHAGTAAVQVLYQKGREIHGKVLTDLNPGDVIEITGGKSNYTLGSPAKKHAEISFLVQKQVHVAKGTVLSRIRNESLIRQMHTDYMEREAQRPADGELILYADAPAVFTVWCGEGKEREAEYTAVAAEPVQRAQNRPVDEQRIRAQMNKTGTSEFYFRNLEIRMEEGIFLTMQQLNTLRRDALSGLARAILTSFSRERGEALKRQEQPKPAQPELLADPKERSGDDKNPNPEFAVLAETEEQLTGIREYLDCRHGGNIRRLYLDTGLAIKKWKAAGNSWLDEEIAGARETELCLVMPAVFREPSETFRNDLAKLLETLPVSGILIRNYEEYTFLKQLGFDKKIILDHNLYVFNQYGKKFWMQNGISDFSAALELNGQELQELGVGESDLMVYGYIPVMLSAQCLRKTAGRCTGQPGGEILTDRYGNHYPVRCCCDGCYNVIYNCHPLSLASQAEAVKELKPRLLRIQFSIETKEQVLAVMEQMGTAFSADAWSAGSETEAEKADYTLGHFRRGIR